MSIKEKYRTLRESISKLILLEKQSSFSNEELECWIDRLRCEVNMICPCKILGYDTFTCKFSDYCKSCKIGINCLKISNPAFIYCEDGCFKCERAYLWADFRNYSSHQKNGMLKLYTCLLFSEMLEGL
jgi:hypothetical protein